MTRLKNRWGIAPLLALCVVALIGGAAFAQRQLKATAGGGRPEVKVELTGSVERGGARLSLDKVENVKPGEILDWQIVSSNEGSGDARDYKAVGHIPAGTALVAGSAAGESGSNVTYSVDGGKTYSTQPARRGAPARRVGEEGARPRLDVHRGALRVVGRARRGRQALGLIQGAR